MSEQTYTIVLADNTTLKGLKYLEYAGYDSYGYETEEGSGSFCVKDIYTAEDLKEIIAE
jgi:glucosamine 6-phosphate synthetase-like amidotransferase/phosphosugar isomerase protein